MGTGRWVQGEIKRNLSLAILLAILLTLTCLPAAAQDDQNPPQSNPPAKPPSDQPASPSPPTTPSPNQTQEPEKKSDSPNPPESPAEKTKDITQQAAQATKQFGQTALDKVREWETGWLTGPYIAKDHPRVPLTSKQRQRIYLQQTFTAPSDYVKRMFLAGYDQWRDSPDQWGQGWGAYGKRFASREAQFIAANSLATLGNAALHYEPRYDQCSCSGFLLRTRHAIARTFVTYDRSEQNLRPQWALFGGAFAAGLLSSTWKPHPQNVWADGGYGVVGQVFGGFLLNFFTEYAGDINRKIGARRKRPSPDSH